MRAAKIYERGAKPLLVAGTATVTVLAAMAWPAQAGQADRQEGGARPAHRPRARHAFKIQQYFPKSWNSEGRNYWTW
ncbi:hypothetical protein [Nonomuraea sp. B1E8]|uniref:hypothetical protein n=1 Tax=unclassified Nonomuraea TaxID=2593643 RepID=UPI00325C438C